MSKKGKAREKKKKDEKKAKSRNTQRKQKYQQFSHAEEEHARLTAPQNPREVRCHDSLSSSMGEDYSSTEVGGYSSRLPSSPAEELATQGFARLGEGNRMYDLEDVSGGDGSDYTCGDYVFDEFSFSKDQIPKVAIQMVGPGPGRQFITLGDQRVKVEILGENFVRLPYD